MGYLFIIPDVEPQGQGHNPLRPRGGLVYGVEVPLDLHTHTRYQTQQH